jgi:hypothetical protein
VRYSLKQAIPVRRILQEIEFVRPQKVDRHRSKEFEIDRISSADWIEASQESNSASSIKSRQPAAVKQLESCYSGSLGRDRAHEA